MGHPLLDLTDKTAVVVGGTSGIGLAISLALAKAGANVIPTGRRAELVKAAASQIEALGRRSLAEPCDVTENASIETLLQKTTAKFGSVHILVNSAGRTKRMPTLDFPESEWNSIMETNLSGTLRTCRVFGRHMIENGASSCQPREALSRTSTMVLRLDFPCGMRRRSIATTRTTMRGRGARCISPRGA